MTETRLKPQPSDRKSDVLTTRPKLISVDDYLNTRCHEGQTLHNLLQNYSTTVTFPLKSIKWHLVAKMFGTLRASLA